MAIADLRRDYDKGGLERSDLGTDALGQFKTWFDEVSGARSGGWWRRVGIAIFKFWHAVLGNPPADVNAMVLATVDKSGLPSSRNVLLKGVDERGFIFYTNYDSRKGRELAENPNAALAFYWSDFERQVCVVGSVTKLSREESEAYFKSRPKGSRLAAWASDQSEVVSDRAALEQKWKEMAARFPTNDVPLPPHWGGYVLSPSSIEFWQGRLNRLHDRFRYTKQPDNSWRVERISP